MDSAKQSIAQQVAQSACDLQAERTGHAPSAVTVVLSDDTLVITLHGALTPAEQDLSKHAEGAAKVQEFHRQLFAASANKQLAAIRRITGVPIREAATEVETTSGTVVHAFTSGAMVQVFLLAHTDNNGKSGAKPSCVTTRLTYMPPGNSHGVTGN